MKITNIISKVFNAHYLFYKDMKEYEKLTEKYQIKDFKLDKKNNFKLIYDRFNNAGSIDSHYFLQDIFIAEKIIDRKIKNHYDIGSRIDGFISHLLSSKINVTMIDIRPLPYNIKHLNFIEGNATCLNNINENSINSLSSLHALEHFGLGRYGDPVDPLAWKKALSEYQRILSKNGTLYLSVPIGPQDMVCFNAHRIYNPNTIVKELNDLELTSFSYIKDMEIKTLSDISTYSETDNYLCGLFEFNKI